MLGRARCYVSRRVLSWRQMRPSCKSSDLFCFVPGQGARETRHMQVLGDKRELRAQKFRVVVFGNALELYNKVH